MRNCKGNPALQILAEKGDLVDIVHLYFQKGILQSPSSKAFKEAKQLWEKQDNSDLDKKLARTQGSKQRG